MRLQGVGLVPGSAKGTARRLGPRSDVVSGPHRPGTSEIWVGSPDDVLGGLEGPPDSRPAGCVISGIELPRMVGPVPSVGGLDPELFRTGDAAYLDGTVGTVELAEVREVPVVTSFLEDGLGRVLVLRRSGRVGSYRGLWAGVSGFLEAAFPVDQALTEIREETGIDPGDLELRRAGAPIRVRSEARIYLVHPFRFTLRRPAEVRLDWEHTEYEWVAPSRLPGLATVPRLLDAWNAVAD